MARRRSGPWLRSSDNCFYTTVGRRLVKLGSADDPWEQVQRAFHSEHAKGEKPSALTVAWLVDEYLEFVQKHRAPTTYRWYKEYLSGFIARVGAKLRAECLTPTMVHDWIQRD